MKRKLFTEMLNSVGPAGSYRHVGDYGLCNWVESVNDVKGEFFLMDHRCQPHTISAMGILSHFSPTAADVLQLKIEGKDYAYWGSDHLYERKGILTDLRATILCFCAAINNEL